MKEQGKPLNLPRRDKEGNPYISYSQISTWKKNKRDYMRQYFLGEAFEGNAYTEFGTKVGEALENNDFSEFTKEEQKFLKTIPRLDVFEHEIKWVLKGFYVKGYIDTMSRGKMKLADYKTGDVATKVAQYEDDSYTQIDIYAAALKQETGKKPSVGEVYVIDRTGNAFKGEELKLGDRFVTVTRDISAKRLKAVEKEVQEIAEEISFYYTIYQRLCQELKGKVSPKDLGTPSTSDGTKRSPRRRSRSTTTK